MISNIGNLAQSSEAGALPIHDPETQEVRHDVDRFFASTCRSSAYRGPDIPAIYFAKFAHMVHKQKVSLAGARVVDFGCGQARPIGLAILLYLAGARRVLAIDLQEVSDQAAVAVMAAATVIAVISGKLRFNYQAFGATWATVRRRAAEFDLKKLLANDLAGGVPDGIWLRQALYGSLAEKDRPFDVMISNSVFEHVPDIPEHLDLFRRSISPHGVIYIAIDYKDHRTYAPGNSASLWQYFMDGDDDDGDINCIRHSRLLEMISGAGFDVVESVLESAVPSDGERAKFLPEYRTVAEADVTTVAAHLLLRPRGTRAAGRVSRVFQRLR